MTDPAPPIDFANLPAPAEGILVTLFITVRKVARSRDFYSRVLGGTVVLDENPCMVKLSNSWIIMNPGGPPTGDKPGISVVDYQPGNTTSIFLNLRVADIQACYEEWKARGAEFVTPPIDRGAEIRCYMRDPDGYSSKSASPPACRTASSPQSARRTSLAELCHRPGNSGQQATIRRTALWESRWPAEGGRGGAGACAPARTRSNRGVGQGHDGGQVRGRARCRRNRPARSRLGQANAADCGR